MWTNRSHLPGGTDASRNNVSKQLRRLPAPKQRNTINTLYCFAYHLGSFSQQLIIYRLSSKENIFQAKAIKHVGHVDDFMFSPPRGSTAPYWERACYLSKFRYHTRLDTPHPVVLLWTSDRPVTQTSIWQHRTHKRQTTIRTRNPSKRSTADLSFSPSGHRNLVYHCTYEYHSPWHSEALRCALHCIHVACYCDKKQ
jgi:hypothetical protein